MRGPGKRPERGRPGFRFAGLSRRRRTLLAAVACLVVAAGAASAVAAVRGGGDRPPGATGPGGPAQDRPGPVVLVPGYGGSTSSLDALAARIRASGRAATVIQLPGAGTGSLLADAALLNSAVDTYLRQGASSVDVVGYYSNVPSAPAW